MNDTSEAQELFKKWYRGAFPQNCSTEHLAEQAFAAGRASMAKVPEDVMAALDRMCTPLDASWLKGVTAEQDARCMKTIRDYVISTLPKDERAALAQRAVEARGLPDDATLNQSAAALAGAGKSEGTIPKDDTQADIGVDGQEPVAMYIGTRDGYPFVEWLNEFKPGDKKFNLYASPRPTPSIPAAQPETENMLPKFHCAFCGKGFLTKQVRNHHEVTCTREKP